MKHLLVLTVGAAIMAGAATSPASADWLRKGYGYGLGDGGGWHEHYDRHHHPHGRFGRGLAPRIGSGALLYTQPRSYYGWPPIYYAPPQAYYVPSPLHYQRVW